LLHLGRLIGRQSAIRHGQIDARAQLCLDRIGHLLRVYIVGLGDVCE